LVSCPGDLVGDVDLFVEFGVKDLEVKAGSAFGRIDL